MKYRARIINTDEQDYKIFGESLAFYVKKALDEASVKVIASDSPNADCALILPDNIPLIKPETIKRILKTNRRFDLTDYNIADLAALKIKQKDLLAVNSPESLYTATEIIKKRINKRHMKNGVIFTDKNAAYIGPKVIIGTGSKILPGAIIEGNTIIGDNCVIGPNTQLINMKIASESEISYSVAYDSVIGGKTKIGPFAYIRPGCDIGSYVKIGDFVEVKNAVIGDGTKAAHLAYLGDADIGSGVNIGCGVITANYDGKNKSRTVIKDGVFVGSNSNLIAPVIIEEGAFIAAGSTITNDVPNNTLAIARARQEIKPDWKR